MQLAIVGLPNKGKSTLFNALTSTEAKTANYPFTTITANQGVAFANCACPHVRLKVQCNPNNAPCENGVRRIPINVMDVAGLVEGAHQGKGMGNQFLSDVAPADALIVVADASGGTDDEGNACAEGTHDVLRDVFLTVQEIDFWLAGILQKNGQKSKGKTFEDFAGALTGLKISIEQLRRAYAKTELLETLFASHSREQYLELAGKLREEAKPLVIAANKADSAHARENVEKLREAFPQYRIFPVASDAEVSLKKARQRGWIAYDGKKFEAVKPDLDPRILEALEKIRHTLDAWGSTGVQDLANACAFDLLGQMAVFPVEDDVHYSNHFGKVLPDAILLRKGGTALQLAERIHTDLAKHFLHALDAETKMRVGKDSPLHEGQVVKIVSAH